MNKNWILFLLVQMTVFAAAAQHCKATFLGSKTLYVSNRIPSPAPKGYIPVFINHVGRHGARHLTSDVMASEIGQLLVKADSAGGLTPAGKRLQEKVMQLANVEKPNIKSISYEGIVEQQGLASRMFTNYPTVFDYPGAVINIAYTKEIRTWQTCNAFMDELLKKIKTPALTKKINDTTLRFYDLSPAYIHYKKNGSWIASLNVLKKALHYKELAASTAQKFFTKDWLIHLTEQDREEFVSGLFGLISIFYSIQKEITDAGYQIMDLDMEPLFDCRQLLLLSKIDNAEDFLLKGPGTNPNGIQINIAAPLLADFISTTDEYMKTKATHVQLRFSHAETIAPFAALLSLKTASIPEMKPAAIQKVWDAGQVIPLSANIQWILYQKKGTDHYLIKFLLNEKETAITGLSTKTFPYYQWSAVRKFYVKKLQQLDLAPGQDYFNYLQQIQ